MELTNLKASLQNQLRKKPQDFYFKVNVLTGTRFIRFECSRMRRFD